MPEAAYSVQRCGFGPERPPGSKSLMVMFLRFFSKETMRSCMAAVKGALHMNH